MEEPTTEELQQLAALGVVKQGHHQVEKRDWVRGVNILVPWTAITYYFNAANVEIGYYNHPCGALQLFDPPRVWGQEIFDNLSLRPFVTTNLENLQIVESTD